MRNGVSGLHPRSPHIWSLIAIPIFLIFLINLYPFVNADMLK
jgi:hypothetical protein